MLARLLVRPPRRLPTRALRCSVFSTSATPKACAKSGGTDNNTKATCSSSTADNKTCGGDAAASSSSSSSSSLRFWSSQDVWQRAAKNTTRCLVGCSIGDLSTLYLLQAYAPELGLPATIAASCAAGITTSMLLETAVLRVTEEMAWSTAWRTAAGMSLVSMVSMELAENAVELYLIGGDAANMAACAAAAGSSTTFWQAVPPAMLAGWLTPLPYNYYMLARYGKGCH